MDSATINCCSEHQEDIEYDKVAVRLLLKTVYRRVVGEYNHDAAELEQKHREQFPVHVKKYVAQAFWRADGEEIDLEKLAASLKIERDELFTYAGLSSLFDRYSNARRAAEAYRIAAILLHAHCDGTFLQRKKPD